MNPTLRNFYVNKNEQEAVHVFLIETLKELAVDKTFSGQSVEGIMEAKEAIDRAFVRLKEIYGKEEQLVINNSR